MTTWTAFEPATDMIPSAGQDVERLGAHKDISTRISLDISVKTAPLEPYIALAEQHFLLKRPPGPIFRRASGVPPPTLRSNQENRVIVFPGAFNPPHLGHTGLLWHTYLSLDDKTIAAMILPMKRSSILKKKLTKSANHKDGRKFALYPHQRRQLWQDEILGRFVWVWPADDCDRSSAFLRYVQNLASEDGFHVDFPSLHGGDHMRSFQRDGSTGWGLGSVITSDVGRSVDFVKGRYEDVRLPHCGEWKEQKKEACDGVHAAGIAQCWACRKLRVVYPEFFQGNFARDEKTTSGDITQILQQCHDSHCTIWVAKKPPTWSPRPYYVVFVPGNRTYGREVSETGAGTATFREGEAPVQSPSLTVSSTMVRGLFFCHESRNDFKQSLKSLVINPELLARFLGMGAS